MPSPLIQWDLIRAEASRLGLPKHYATDLEHDRRILEHENPDRFVWQIYTCGTHLYSLSTCTTGQPIWNSFPFAVFQMYHRDPERHWYTFDRHPVAGSAPRCTLTEVTPYEWFAFYFWAVRGGRWGERDVWLGGMPISPHYGFPREVRDNAHDAVMRYESKYRAMAAERREWLRGREIPYCRGQAKP